MHIIIASLAVLFIFFGSETGQLVLTAILGQESFDTLAAAPMLYQQSKISSKSTRKYPNYKESFRCRLPQTKTSQIAKISARKKQWKASPRYLNRRCELDKVTDSTGIGNTYTQGLVNEHKQTQPRPRS